jgi:homoserine O-acetyltransferase
MYVCMYVCICSGGMQALEWALLGGPFVSAAVVIGCGAAHSAWQIAISSTQRQAIFADQKWRNGHVDPRWADLMFTASDE